MQMMEGSSYYHAREATAIEESLMKKIESEEDVIYGPI